jgi:large subunit ribosomal protein L4
MKTDIYNHSGKAAGTIELPSDIFDLSWNADLVHQVAVGMQSNARANSAHTKDRSEVRGGGRKPWRQKGTGQARHGSRRSPIWKGGGVTFGPRSERNYEKKINKKMRVKALYTALSQKVRDNEVIFIESLDKHSGKTRDMNETLQALAGIKGFETLNTKKANNVFMTSAHMNDELKQAAKNIFHVTLAQVENLNLLDVINHRYLIISGPQESIDFLKSKAESKSN